MSQVTRDELRAELEALEARLIEALSVRGSVPRVKRERATMKPAPSDIDRAAARRIAGSMGLLVRRPAR